MSDWRRPAVVTLSPCRRVGTGPSAGKISPRPPLPAPELDVHVDFARTDPDERARLKAAADRQRQVIAAQTAEITSRVTVTMVADLSHAHPLVTATKKFCDRLPKLVEQYRRKGIQAWSLSSAEAPFSRHRPKLSGVHRRGRRERYRPYPDSPGMRVVVGGAGSPPSLTARASPSPCELARAAAGPR